jgi:hypothetical protein
MDQEVASYYLYKNRSKFEVYGYNETNYILKGVNAI